MLSLPENFWVGVFGTVVYGLLGILMLLCGFKVFDAWLSKVDFEKVMNDNPLGACIVIGAFLLSVAHIVASVVH